MGHILTAEMDTRTLVSSLEQNSENMNDKRTYYRALYLCKNDLVECFLLQDNLEVLEEFYGRSSSDIDCHSITKASLRDDLA